MEAAVLIAALALGVSAVGFFYKIGRDTGAPPPPSDKLDQVLAGNQTINKKLDAIAEWQREAASIHASHGEQIKTLFNRLETVEHRMEDRKLILQALTRILEKKD